MPQLRTRANGHRQVWTNTSGFEIHTPQHVHAVLRNERREVLPASELHGESASVVHGTNGPYARVDLIASLQAHGVSLVLGDWHLARGYDVFTTEEQTANNGQPCGALQQGVAERPTPVVPGHQRELGVQSRDRGRIECDRERNSGVQKHIVIGELLERPVIASQVETKPVVKPNRHPSLYKVAG